MRRDKDILIHEIHVIMIIYTLVAIHARSSISTYQYGKEEGGEDRSILKLNLMCYVLVASHLIT